MACVTNTIVRFSFDLFVSLFCLSLKDGLGFGQEDHDIHKLKAAEQDVKDASKELMKRKWDLAVAKAEAENASKNTKAKSGPSISCGFNSQLEQHLLVALQQANEQEQKNDGVTLLCMSLADRLRALSAKTSRRVQLKMLQVLNDAEDMEENDVPEKISQRSLTSTQEVRYCLIVLICSSFYKLMFVCFENLSPGQYMLSFSPLLLINILIHDFPFHLLIKFEVTKYLKAPPDSRIITAFGISVFGADLLTLKPTTCLNDNVRKLMKEHSLFLFIDSHNPTLFCLSSQIVNFYLSLVQDRSHQRTLNLPYVKVFSTFFYTELSSRNFESVKQWTKTVRSQVFIIVYMNMHAIFFFFFNFIALWLMMPSC